MILTDSCTGWLEIRRFAHAARKLMHVAPNGMQGTGLEFVSNGETAKQTSAYWWKQNSKGQLALI